MKEIKNKLDEIKSIYFSNLGNNQKYSKVVNLWDEYYKLCNKNNIYLDEVEDLRMMFENECYFINQEPKY